tara:strand:- start:6825 stop:7373 length:549 start_codon:yes stop_codon:yes gene_type:complete
MFNIKQLFLFILFVAVSCDSSTTQSEDHVDAEGFVLEVGETVVYREFEGEITVNELTMAVGAMIEVSVHLLDHDGNEIEHDDEEEEEAEGLTFDVVDTSIISVEAEEHEEDGDDGHDHEGHELGFELTGLAEGTTTFTFSVMHDGHADYTSLPISVTITPAMFSCNGICLKNCCAVAIYATK